MLPARNAQLSNTKTSFFQGQSHQPSSTAKGSKSTDIQHSLGLHSRSISISRILRNRWRRLMRRIIRRYQAGRHASEGTTNDRTGIKFTVGTGIKLNYNNSLSKMKKPTPTPNPRSAWSRSASRNLHTSIRMQSSCRLFTSNGNETPAGRAWKMQNRSKT